MNAFRRLSTKRLVVLLAALAAVAAAGAVAAVTALGGSGATPPPASLADAVHNALAASPVAGVTARISFTNHLLGSDALGGLGGGSSPLLSGASGRLWLAADGRLRLELQSDSGDVQIVDDGKTLTAYDGTSNTAYELTLPPQDPSTNGSQDLPPSVAQITQALTGVAQWADVSGATPDSVAGQPAYTVDVTPQDSGGLIGGVEVSFDAATGVPLHVAIDARGSSSPVIDLSVTDISYGAVSDSDVDLAPPAGAHLVALPSLTGGSGGTQAQGQEVTGVGPVAAAVPFTLAAPDAVAGLSRSDVRLLGSGADAGALVTYGQGLGTLAVVEHAAKSGAGATGSNPLASLPSVSLGAATGHELVTALGTVVSFDRGGVSYAVAGSVTQADAESAARTLAS